MSSAKKHALLHATLSGAIGAKKKHAPVQHIFPHDDNEPSGGPSSGGSSSSSAHSALVRRSGSRINRCFSDEEQKVIGELTDELTAVLKEVDEWQRKIDGQVAENQELMQKILNKSFDKHKSKKKTSRKTARRFGETQFVYPLHMLGPSAPVLPTVRQSNNDNNTSNNSQNAHSVSTAEIVVPPIRTSKAPASPASDRIGASKAATARAPVKGDGGKSSRKKRSDASSAQTATTAALITSRPATAMGNETPQLRRNESETGMSVLSPRHRSEKLAPPSRRTPRSTKVKSERFDKLKPKAEQRAEGEGAAASAVTAEVVAGEETTTTTTTTTSQVKIDEKPQEQAPNTSTEHDQPKEVAAAEVAEVTPAEATSTSEKAAAAVNEDAFEEASSSASDVSSSSFPSLSSAASSSTTTTQQQQQQPQPAPSEADAAKLRLRQNIAKEILQTEKNYGQTLTTLVDQYLLPLRKLTGTPKQIVSKEDLRTVFYQLEVLRGINSLIECQLQARVEAGWHEQQTLGDVFLAFSSALRAYSTYINNYSQALSHLGELQGNAQFTRFCRRRKGEWLDSLLIQPVQRIPQYIMLLSSLLDATPAGHPDFVLLTKGLQAVKLTAAQNHRAQRVLENAIVLQGLERKLAMRLSEGHRQFVRSFDVLLWDLKKKRVHRRAVFLFSDMLLIAKQLGGGGGGHPVEDAISSSSSSTGLAASIASSSSASSSSSSSSSTPHTARETNNDSKYKVLERLNLIDILRIVRERSIIREILPDANSITVAFSEAQKKLLHGAAGGGSVSGLPASSDDEYLWETSAKRMFILATLFRPLILSSTEKDEVVSAINTQVAEVTDNVRSRDTARF